MNTTGQMERKPRSNIIRNLSLRVSGDYWEAIRTIWPYEDGWGVWNPMTHTNEGR